MGQNHSLLECEDCTRPLSPRLGPPKVTVHETKTPGELETTRLAAVELEVVWDGPTAGSRRDHRPHVLADLSPEVAKAAKKWKATVGRDRYGPMGYELNMAPAAGTKFAMEANDYQEAFIKDGIYVTDQCGGHVHVDARDFCIDDVCKLLQAYWMVEPALYAVIPAYRSSHVAGVTAPCAKVASYYMDYGLDKVTGLESAKAFKARLEPAGRNRWHERHCGLNMQSLFKHGTVEFRFPPAMLEAKDMISWARLLTRLVNFAKATKFLRLKKIFTSAQPTAASSLELLSKWLNSSACDTFLDDQVGNATKRWKAMRSKKLADILPAGREQEAAAR